MADEWVIYNPWRQCDAPWRARKLININDDKSTRPQARDVPDSRPGLHVQVLHTSAYAYRVLFTRVRLT